MEWINLSGSICRILLPWIAFFIRSKKRSHPVCRFLLCLGIYILFCILFPEYLIYMALPKFAWFLLFFVNFILLFAFCFFCICDTVCSAFYCALWCYTIYFFNLQLVGLFRSFLLLYLSCNFGHITYILRFPVSAVTFCLVFFLIVPKIQTNGMFCVRPKQTLLAAVTVIPVIVFNNHIYQWDGTGGIVIFLFQIFSLLCCICALFLQRNQTQRHELEQELYLIRQLWYKEQQQYRISEENIALINQKCHDLRHQILALQYMIPQEQQAEFFHEIQHSIQIYDCIVQTGNAVLDTVLTEKSLYCDKKKIRLLCVADGKPLKFMNVVDIYSIFGNALENAIESVRQIQEPSLRAIDVKVYTEQKLLRICIENYCEKNLAFENGMPLSTKEQNGFHGFGLKSIRYIAEKYGGCMTVEVQNHIFSLKILLPIPNQDDSDTPEL